MLPKREKRQAAASPLLQRRGGCAIKKNCEATFDAQTGWSEMFFTTPSAPIKGCLRRYFLEVASVPSSGRGDWQQLNGFTRNGPTVHLENKFHRELEKSRIQRRCDLA